MGDFPSYCSLIIVVPPMFGGLVGTFGAGLDFTWRSVGIEMEELVFVIGTVGFTSMCGKGSCVCISWCVEGGDWWVYVWGSMSELMCGSESGSTCSCAKSV